jgi:hypothetical protein
MNLKISILLFSNVLPYPAGEADPAYPVIFLLFTTCYQLTMNPIFILFLNYLVDTLLSKRSDAWQPSPECPHTQPVPLFLQHRGLDR